MVSFPAHSFTPKEQKIINLLSSLRNGKESPSAKVIYSIPSQQVANPPTLWKYETDPFEQWLLKEPKLGAEQDGNEELKPELEGAPCNGCQTSNVIN